MHLSGPVYPGLTDSLRSVGDGSAATNTSRKSPCETKMTDQLTNKKVFLRERKRHTDRHVASTPVVLTRGGGATPSLGSTPVTPSPSGPGRGTPPPCKAGWGTPPSGPSWGTPHPRLDGVPGGGVCVRETAFVSSWECSNLTKFSPSIQVTCGGA